MAAPRRLALRGLLLLAALGALAGCSSSDGGTRLYLLEPAMPADSPAALPAGFPGVVVAAVRLPRYLDRAQIVTRGGEHRLQLAEFDQWAGDLGQDLTRTLAANLSRLLGSGNVVAAPHTLRAADAFRVEVEVLGFERGADGRVRLAARWWVARGADAAPISGTANAQLAGDPLPADARYDAIVASMSRVWGEFARPVALAIRAGSAAKP